MIKAVGGFRNKLPCVCVCMWTTVGKEWQISAVFRLELIDILGCLWYLQATLKEYLGRLKQSTYAFVGREPIKTKSEPEWLQVSTCSVCALYQQVLCVHHRTYSHTYVEHGCHIICRQWLGANATWVLARVLLFVWQEALITSLVACSCNQRFHRRLGHGQLSPEESHTIILPMSQN